MALSIERRLEKLYTGGKIAGWMRPTGRRKNYKIVKGEDLKHITVVYQVPPSQVNNFIKEASKSRGRLAQWKEK